MGNAQTQEEHPEDHIPSFPHDNDEPQAIYQDEDPRYPFQEEMDRARDDSILPDYDWLIGEPGSVREDLLARTLHWFANDDDYNAWWKSRWGSTEEFLDEWNRTKERIPRNRDDLYGSDWGKVNTIYERLYATRNQQMRDGNALTNLLTLLGSDVYPPQVPDDWEPLADNDFLRKAGSISSY